MKRASTPDSVDTDSKTALERFTQLGEKLMAVPRAEVEKAEKKWNARKHRKKRR